MEEKKNSEALNYLKWFFFRDMDIDIHTIISSIAQCIMSLILVSFATFLIGFPDSGFPKPSNIGQNIFYVVGALGIIIGGAFIDSIVKTQKIQNIINTLSTLLVTLIIYIKEISNWYFFFLSLFTFVSGISIIIALKIFLGQSTLLNRGRYASLLVLVLSVFGIPFVIITSSLFVFFVVMMFFWVFIYFWERKHPLPREIFPIDRKIRADLDAQKNCDTKHLESALQPHERYRNAIARLKAYFNTKEWSEILTTTRKMLKEIFTNIMRSRFIPFLILFFGISVMIGFNLSITITYNLNLTEYVIIGILLFLSLVGFGILMDYVGRKPIAIIAISIFGIHSIFYGFPGFQWPGFVSFLFYLIIISITLILMMGIMGDTSDFLSRGRIIGITVFVVLVGVILGFQIDNIFHIVDQLDQGELRYGLSAIMSLIAFICMILLHTITEPFQRESIHWKDYLDRIVLLDKYGVNLFYYNFRSDMVGQSKQEVNRDLVSGGLTGIEMMIKEISQSDHHLDILEQADKKIIFVHGKFTIFVLFTTNYLSIHKQKLQRFLEEFEYINYDVIKKFSGMVSDLKGIDALMWKYFRVKITISE